VKALKTLVGGKLVWDASTGNGVLH